MTVRLAITTVVVALITLLVYTYLAAPPGAQVGPGTFRPPTYVAPGPFGGGPGASW